MALDEEQSSAAQEMRRAIDCLGDCADLAEVDPATLQALAAGENGADQHALPKRQTRIDSGHILKIRIPVERSAVPRDCDQRQDQMSQDSDRVKDLGEQAKQPGRVAKFQAGRRATFPTRLGFSGDARRCRIRVTQRA